MAQPQFQNVKGMNDLLPGTAAQWAFVEQAIKDALAHFHYEETRIPVVEKTALFKRSIGDVTDVVEKEMYTFDDRDNESLSLRPEATAGVVRSAIQNGLLHNQTQRLWTIGPMFRYEKPQKGRMRQFHQVDVEAFGFLGPDIDAEIIALSQNIWQRLGVTGAELHINSLGTSETRQRYRDDLIAYFEAHESVLDEEAKERLHRNPLRLLDSKNPAMQDVVANAPDMMSYLSDECRAHFDTLCEMLDGMGITYTINPKLVRGLDYYNRTVFEWIAPDGLGSQNTICGGGRYDGLVEQLGGKSVPGIGFGLGLERLILLLESQELLKTPPGPDYFIILDVASEDYAKAVSMTHQIRQSLQDATIELNCGGASFKSQMKRADKSGAQTALIIGKDEFANEAITVKPLRGGDQRTLPLKEWLDSLS